MNKRRGFTLIEMVAVITISTTLMGIAVLLLNALLKTHNTGREQLQYCATLNRLAQQFRTDVHAREKTSSNKNSTTLDLLPASKDGTTVRYEFLPDRIDRTEKSGEKVFNQESYLLLPDMTAELKIESQDGVDIARIVISPKIKAQAGTESAEPSSIEAARRQMPKFYQPSPVKIEAVLGRDSKITKSMSKPATEDKP